MLLVHPVQEGGMRFLPCVYGYATTVRRAQGADLDLGCVFFDQRRPAGRGYGYMGVSRFRTRGGCYLYGKAQRTDFLPVGPNRDDEVLERGYDSVSTEEGEGADLEYAYASSEDEEVDRDLTAGSAACLEPGLLECDFV